MNNYNIDVRAYDSKSRAHRIEVGNQRRHFDLEIRRLNWWPTARTFVTYRSSVETVASTYPETEKSLVGRTITPTGRDLLDRRREEAANSAYSLSAKDRDGATDDDLTENELWGPSMQAELEVFGLDLVDRWTGAFFSISLSNPDAARLFCASDREVLIAMIDGAAPDAYEVEAEPSCDRTDRACRPDAPRSGPSCVARASIEVPVEEDVYNVLRLFREFSDRTHSHADRFAMTLLNILRIRVESAISYIHSLCVV